MRAIRAMLVGAICVLGIVRAQADPGVESVQQNLKGQGFYYGEITGTVDAETSAAIRRYQIRHGLKITGELDAATRKALGAGGISTPRSTPPPVATPRVVPPPQSEPDIPELRDDDPIVDEEAPGGDREPLVPVPSRAGLFDGTPYENAPPEVQQRVIVGAQALLARRGYYRSGVDGVFGPGTAFALRAYQARFGLETTGAFDVATLASMGLLPEQRAPGLTAPRRRVFRRPPVIYTPDGEPIYVPR